MSSVNLIIEYLNQGLYTLCGCLKYACLFYVVFLGIMVLCRKRNKESFSLKKCVPEFFLTLWLCLILKVTGMTEITELSLPSYFSLKNLIFQIPFYGNSFSMIILNILLFVPLGFFLQAAVPAWRSSWKKSLPAGILFSVCIEIIQIFSGRLFEIDDILANSSGVLLGILLFSSFTEIRKREVRKRGAKRLVITVILYALFGCILFILANGEQAQKQEEELYPGIADDKAAEDILEIRLISAGGIFSGDPAEDGDFDTAYWWMADAIDSHMSCYVETSGSKMPDIEEPENRESDYVEVIYAHPHDFSFYNRKDFRMTGVQYLFYDAKEGSLWYGENKERIFGILKYQDETYPFSPDEDLLGLIETGKES